MRPLPLLAAVSLTALLTTSTHSQAANSRAASSQAALCKHLRSMTQEPAVLSAHWGISVTTLAGASVCGIDDAQLFRPASNNKLLTTAAAFALLSPESTVQTQVLGSLDTATGTVSGDLTLLGAADGNLDSGDLPYLPPTQQGSAAPAFRFRDMEALASQLAAKGVKSIAGDVVGDDTLFPDQRYPPSWNADDLLWGYGAPVSALSVADNQLRLLVTPAEHAGTPAEVTLDQHGVAYYTVQAEVETRRKGAAGLGVGVERVPGSRVLRVYGAVAEAEPDAEQVAIEDPAFYAAMAFTNALRVRGITVSGTVRPRHRPVEDAGSFLAALNAPGGQDRAIVSGQDPGSAGPCTPAAATLPPVLAAHVSARLAQDATFTNKTSQNLHAELLLRRLGLLASCSGDMNLAGARMVRAFLLHAGVDPQDFTLYDGSGLSDHDLVAPRALTRLLGYASTQPWFAAWRQTLPVGGVDGSLAARFTGLLKGRVEAKTGTLGESRALSGYVTTAHERTLAFSILVDTHLPGSGADRIVMDRMVEAIAAEQ